MNNTPLTLYALLITERYLVSVMQEDFLCGAIATLRRMEASMLRKSCQAAGVNNNPV